MSSATRVDRGRDELLGQRGLENVRFQVGEERAREIALAGVAHDRDDQLARVLGRLATCIAAQRFAPDEMPARIPSSRASRRAVATESSNEALITSEWSAGPKYNSLCPKSSSAPGAGFPRIRPLALTPNFVQTAEGRCSSPWGIPGC